MRRLLETIRTLLVIIAFMLIFVIGKLIEITPTILLLANP